MGTLSKLTTSLLLLALTGCGAPPEPPDQGRPEGDASPPPQDGQPATDPGPAAAGPGDVVGFEPAAAGLSSFDGLLEGETITISVNVSGVDQGQIDFAEMIDARPMVLHVQTFEEQGVVSVTAPASYKAPLFVSAMGHGEDRKVSDAVEIVLDGTDLQVSLVVDQELPEPPPGGVGGPDELPPEELAPAPESEPAPAPEVEPSAAPEVAPSAAPPVE